LIKLIIQIIFDRIEFLIVREILAFGGFINTLCTHYLVYFPTLTFLIKSTEFTVD
jgi:hypothetical protein